MDLVTTLVALVATVLATTAICSRLDLPSPLVLIVVGIVGSYLPFVPDIHLDPEVVLLGLLPPLLYAAALQTSLVDFNANRRPILLLSVGLVAFTTAGVAVLVHAMIDGLGWAGSFAIGAVVAPPDAIAASAIGRRIGLPRRIVTILEGESLLNDATALVALRTATAAATAASVSWAVVGRDFVVAAGGGVLVGLAFFFVVGMIRRQVTDPVLDSGLSFVTPFAAYIAAEKIHASGVISVVVASLFLGHKAPILQVAQSRIAERMTWRSIAFLLEGGVFLLIGLQGRAIIRDAGNDELGGVRIALICALVLVAVIVLRLVWVFFARYALVRPGPDATGRVPPWTYTFLLGWAGMRGVVTLAAAFAIPKGMPHREVLLLIAFTVTAGTLFLQGLTLPALARVLRVPSPDPGADALARANLLHQASLAGLAKLENLAEEDPHDVSETIRERVRRRDYAAWEHVNASSAETPSETYARRRRLMIEAERGRVLEIRSTGTVPHEVVTEVLAMLDVEESMLDHSEGERARVRASVTGMSMSRDAACPDLRDARGEVVANTPGECEECVRDGSRWVHLRLCLACGHVGCCDSSPHRHATAHFHATEHPVVRSAEPGEDWLWCYRHELTG